MFIQNRTTREDFQRYFDDQVSGVLVQVIRHVLQGLFRIVRFNDPVDGYGFHGALATGIPLMSLARLSGIWSRLR